MVINMTQLQIDFWNFILSTISTLIVIVASVAGVIRYFQEKKRDREVRREELAWRKTQFILELANEFEKDVQHQLVWRFLTYGTRLPKNSTLKKILEKNTSALNQSESKLRYAIDDYLDFFDRIYYFTFVTESLNISDIEVFGWYIAQIGETRELHDYAKVAGFEDVLILCKELRNQFGKKHWYKAIHKRLGIRKGNGVRKILSKSTIEA